MRGLLVLSVAVGTGLSPCAAVPIEDRSWRPVDNQAEVLIGELSRMAWEALDGSVGPRGGSGPGP